MKDFILRPIRDADRERVMEIFNYYVLEGPSAYPESPLPNHFFDILLKEAYRAYVVEIGGRVAGFGLLKGYLPVSSFSHTAQLSYFLDPDARGLGLGTALLDRLVSDARSQGIGVLLVHLSSQNAPSVAFHKHHGFSECGRFPAVGKKSGQVFDQIWMYRNI
jgi:phosphinothricin acetyltransferase